MARDIQIPAAGSPIDLAPFGRVIYYYGDDPRKRRFVDAATEGGHHALSEPDRDGHRHLVLHWAEPRDIYSVAVTFEPGRCGAGQARSAVLAEQVAVPRQGPRRGAHRGWIGRDDHYRGEWLTALSGRVGRRQPRDLRLPPPGHDRDCRTLAALKRPRTSTPSSAAR